MMLGALVMTATAHAATYYVAPTGNDSNAGTQAAPFKTIGKGMNTAASGDNVLLADGTYTGAGNKNLTFGGKNIVVKSQSGNPAACFIDCQNNGYGFRFINGETAAARIQGLTVQNGMTIQNSSPSRSGGGVLIENSSPTVANCNFVGNIAAELGGGIVAVNSNALITDCIFNANNTLNQFVGYGGGGVGIVGGSPKIVRCIFNANHTRSAGSGILCVVGSTVTVSGCVFTNNVAGGEGGGGICSSNSTPTIISCTFRDNLGNSGGAILNQSSSGVIRHCTIDDNSAEFYGGGIYNTASSPTIANCLVTINHADHYGGGLYNRDGSSPIVTHCTFDANVAGLNSGHGIYSVGSTPIITNCILWGSVNPVAGQATMTYCCVKSFPVVPDADHNFGTDPLFVRNAYSNTDSGDLRLQSGSPCINAGTASAPGIPAYDLLGRVRIAGSAPDMGAYETNSTPYAEQNIYVDKAAGSDTTGSGTQAAPFQTVAKALLFVDSPAYTAIHVKAGNYGSDKPSVGQRVRFVNWTNAGRAAIGK